MGSKALIESRTIVINGILGIITLVGLFTGHKYNVPTETLLAVAELIISVLVVGNLVLRKLTDKPIKGILPILLLGLLCLPIMGCELATVNRNAQAQLIHTNEFSGGELLIGAPSEKLPGIRIRFGKGGSSTAALSAGQGEGVKFSTKHGISTGVEANASNAKGILSIDRETTMSIYPTTDTPNGVIGTPIEEEGEDDDEDDD
jgi:hypothetical protein